MNERNRSTNHELRSTKRSKSRSDAKIITRDSYFVIRTSTVKFPVGFFGYANPLSRGFTLIELILVVAMMILLGTLSSTFAARFLTQNGVLNASDQIIGDIRKAQINAMTGKQNSNWGVNYSSNTITLYKGNSYATRQTAFDEKFSVSASINISGFSDVTFARMTGTPSATPTITISGSGETKTITINSQGVATR